LGSRSQDDLIAGYSIEEQEKMHAASQQYVPTLQRRPSPAFADPGLSSGIGKRHRLPSAR
jgi:hypothetical protein